MQHSAAAADYFRDAAGQFVTYIYRVSVILSTWKITSELRDLICLFTSELELVTNALARAPQAVQPAAGGRRGGLAPPRGGGGSGPQRHLRGRRVRRPPLPRRLLHGNRGRRRRRDVARRRGRGQAERGGGAHGSPPGRTRTRMGFQTSSRSDLTKSAETRQICSTTTLISDLEDFQF